MDRHQLPVRLPTMTIRVTRRAAVVTLVVYAFILGGNLAALWLIVPCDGRDLARHGDLPVHSARWGRGIPRPEGDLRAGRCFCPGDLPARTPPIRGHVLPGTARLRIS